MDGSKYLKQRGTLPIGISAIGMFIHLYFILGSLVFVTPGVINNFVLEPFIPALFLFLIIIGGMTALLWPWPLLAGAIFVSAFPEIKLTYQGVETRVYKIFRKKYKWSEIREIIELPNNFIALVIYRPGFSLFNGLYENRLYGQFIKKNKKPVLFLSSKLEKREEALKFIKSKSNIN